MNSDFAGSSSHDDRRRRRLLSEQVISEESSGVVFLSNRIESSRNHRYPVKRIVHYRAWKIWLLAVSLLLCGAALLYASWADQQHDLGSGFSFVFDANTGRIFPVAAAGILFLCGQLSWLIGWARSRSLTDYSGRFRVWRYIGLSFFLASISVLIGADRVLNDSLAFANVQLPWNSPELNWIIPAGGIVMILLWFGDREMKVSKLGRTHLWLAAGLLAGGLGLPLVPTLSIPALVVRGMILGGLIGLLTSLLWFARHVFYLSAEPAARENRPGVLGRLLAAWQRRASRKRAEAGDSESARTRKKGRSKAKFAAADGEDGAPLPKRRRGFRRKTATDQDSNRDETGASSSADDGSRSRTSERTAASQSPPIVKLDPSELSVSELDEEVIQERIEMMELLASEGEPLDQEILKGLTKKQKKRLRNHWRELERSYQVRRAG
jgi:hypothetical protein